MPEIIKKMALQCGIVGLANTGKTTIFNCISNTRGETSAYAFSSSKSNVGQITVPDHRLNELAKYQVTEKIVSTTVEIVDIPGLAKGAYKGEGVGNRFLADIRNTDAIIHVLRCFDDPSLPHMEGSVDPVRDMELVDFELQVKDIEQIERKLQKLDKMMRVGDKTAKRGFEILTIYKEHLNNLLPARTAPVNPEDIEWVRDMQLLSMKPVLYVCNVDDASATTGNHYVERVGEALASEKCEIIVIAGALESEIASLEDPADREAFLEDSGLSEPGVNRLVRAAYDILKLRTFFTVGPKEIRAWTIREGMNAQQAAGVIHSDLERGFIRAEVMKYHDFITLGSEHAVKNAGKFNVEGKTYIVQDGDIMHIRFNV